MYISAVKAEDITSYNNTVTHLHPPPPPNQPITWQHDNIQTATSMYNKTTWH